MSSCRIQVSYEALKKRYDQGWVLEMIDDVDLLVERVKTARRNKEVKKQTPHSVFPFIIINIVN